MNTKHYVWGKSNTSWSTASYFQAWWWLHHVIEMLVIITEWGVFQDKKERSLVQSAFHVTLGDEFTFQQENNLKYKAKYTQVAYQDDTECDCVSQVA
jgi:hypothetical protein